MPEQLPIIQGLAKKCKNCRKAKDIKPVGYYQCAICKYYWFTE